MNMHQQPPRSCGDNQCLVERLSEEMTHMLSELKSSQETLMKMVQQTFEHRVVELKERMEDLREEKSAIHKELYNRIEGLEIKLSEREGKLMTREVDIMAKVDARVKNGVQHWHEADETYQWAKRQKSTAIWLWRTIGGAIALPILYFLWKIATHVAP